MRNIASSTYDFVIVQNVIHHLAEPRYKDTIENCICAMNECIRVIKEGGRLIICESTVKRWFELLEKTFYKIMIKCCDFLHFDHVYQFSSTSLRDIIEDKILEKTSLIKEENIGQGKYVLFLGRKMRSSLLPLTVTFFVIEKGHSDEKQY